MELRNLTRYYTFKRALFKRNKTAEHRFSPRHVAILFAARYLSRQAPYFTLTALYKRLQFLRMHFDMSPLQKEIDHLTRCGYINKIKTKHRFYNNKYHITIDGINELTDLEQWHRDERIDK